MHCQYYSTVFSQYNNIAVINHNNIVIDDSELEQQAVQSWSNVQETRDTMFLVERLFSL